MWIPHFRSSRFSNALFSALVIRFLANPLSSDVSHHLDGRDSVVGRQLIQIGGLVDQVDQKVEREAFRLQLNLVDNLSLQVEPDVIQVAVKDRMADAVRDQPCALPVG